MDRPPMMNPPPMDNQGLRGPPPPGPGPQHPPPLGESPYPPAQQQQPYYPQQQQGGYPPNQNYPPQQQGGNYPPPGNYPPQQQQYGGPPPSSGLRGGQSQGYDNNYDNRGGLRQERNNNNNNRGNYNGNVNEDFIRRQRYPRLYVGKFGRGTRKNELLDIFEKYGNIVDSMFKEDYGFIEYENLEDAAVAMHELDGFEVRGGRMVVEESKPRQNDQKKNSNKAMGQPIRYPRLYVGKIGGVKVQELERLFERFGQIVDCMVQKEQDYGFVEFQTCDQAQRAMEALHHSRFRGNRINVEESKPRNDGLPRNAPPSGKRGQPGGNRSLAKDAKFAKIRGLPFNQNKDDLTTLIHKECSQISADHVVLEFDICGKFSGSAYVKLNTPNDLNDLKRLEKENLGKRYIEVIPVDQEDYDYGVKNNIPEDPRVNKEPKEGENASGLIRIRGIPYKCTEEQIRLLLKGFQILDVKLLQQGNKQAGEALVVFSSKEAAMHSLNWEGQQIESRYIEITLSNMKEFETFVQHGWDTNKIKEINEKEEKRLKEERNSRMQRQGGGNDNRGNDNRGNDNNRGYDNRGGQQNYNNNNRGRRDSRDMGGRNDRERSRPMHNNNNRNNNRDNRDFRDNRDNRDNNRGDYRDNRGGQGRNDNYGQPRGGYDNNYSGGGFQQNNNQHRNNQNNFNNNYQQPSQQNYQQPPSNNNNNMQGGGYGGQYQQPPPHQQQYNQQPPPMQQQNYYQQQQGQL